MMSVRSRLALVAARWWFKERKAPPRVVSRLNMRCIWFDADINRHMNNSRYLALMDIGRYHFTMVSGLIQELLPGRRWFPVVGGVEISYKRSIKPGDRFVLETRLVETSRKTATLTQKFWLGDTLAAEARVTLLFLKAGKVQDIDGLHERYPHLLPKAEP